MQHHAVVFLVVGLDGHGVVDGEAVAGAEAGEVPYGDDADVGGVVPLVGQFAGDRGLAVKEQLHAVSPVGEVRKAHDAAPAHAKHLADEFEGMFDLLQGLAEHHEVEEAVRVVANLVVDVALQNGKPPAYAFGGLGLVAFDSVAADVFQAAQNFQQFATAAAKVQNARSLGDPRGDEREVETHGSGSGPGLVPVEVSGDEGGQTGVVEQKGVVSPLGVDLAEADVQAVALEGLDELAGLVGGVEPVRGERNGQKARPGS